MTQETCGVGRFTIESLIKDKDGNVKHHSIVDENGEEKVYI